jgi:hypothetical protein
MITYQGNNRDYIKCKICILIECYYPDIITKKTIYSQHGNNLMYIDIKITILNRFESATVFKRGHLYYTFAYLYLLILCIYFENIAFLFSLRNELFLLRVRRRYYFSCIGLFYILLLACLHNSFFNKIFIWSYFYLYFQKKMLIVKINILL